MASAYFVRLDLGKSDNSTKSYSYLFIFYTELSLSPCRITHKEAVIVVTRGRDSEAMKVVHRLFKDLLYLIKNRF